MREKTIERQQIRSFSNPALVACLPVYISPIYLQRDMFYYQRAREIDGKGVVFQAPFRAHKDVGWPCARRR